MTTEQKNITRHNDSISDQFYSCYYIAHLGNYDEVCRMFGCYCPGDTRGWKNADMSRRWKCLEAALEKYPTDIYASHIENLRRLQENLGSSPVWTATVNKFVAQALDKLIYSIENYVVAE